MRFVQPYFMLISIKNLKTVGDQHSHNTVTERTSEEEICHNYQNSVRFLAHTYYPELGEPLYLHHPAHLKTDFIQYF